MKKLLSAILAVTMLLCMVVPAFANEVAVYISYNKGKNSYDGFTDATPKKSLGKAGEGGALDELENGGYLVLCERFFVGGNYTFKTRGEVIFTANYGGVDYKNAEPATNPASGAMKFASGAVLTIESDVVFDDMILFQEAAQNKIIVKDGASLTITDKIVTMSKQPYYMVIEVERGGKAVINGGTYSAVKGAGEITLGKNVKIVEEDAPTDAPSTGAADVCFLSYSGSNSNSGLSASEPKKGYSGGIFDVLTTGGTVVVVGKSYIAGGNGVNAYTFPTLANPLTFTSVWNGVDYKNAEPANNPACAFKLGSGTVLNITSDVIFDDIILFQENQQNTLHVQAGATLIVTDKTQFMTKPGNDYHFKVQVDAGAVAILSEEAQKVFTVEGDGDVITYTPDGDAAPTQTVVKMTIGKSVGYINDVENALDAAPIIRESRSMLPVRFVAEAFGATVGWDGATSTATVKTSDVEIKITIGAKEAVVNGKTVALDAPAFIENSRTYMPVRFVAENLGATVAWDGTTSTATLTK